MTPLAAPALPLHDAGPYVAAAYMVFVAILLIYISLMARRLMKTERGLVEISNKLAERDKD